jgi:predicted nucleotide-binding protein (sugar kinase/HSP70/actin superfamily)
MVFSLGSIGITNLYRRKSVSLYFYCIIEFLIYLLKQKKNNLGGKGVFGFFFFLKMYNYLPIFVNCFLQLGSMSVFVISNWLFYNYQLEIGAIGSLYI